MSLRAATINVSIVADHTSSLIHLSSTCAKSTWTSQAQKSISSLNWPVDNHEQLWQWWTKAQKKVQALTKVTSMNYLKPPCLSEKRYEASPCARFQTSWLWHKLWHLTEMLLPSTYTRSFSKSLKLKNRKFSSSRGSRRGGKILLNAWPTKKVGQKARQKLAWLTKLLSKWQNPATRLSHST